MKEANKMLKNTSYLYFRMAITVFISLYTTRLILKELGVIDFGIFNLVGGMIAMLTFLNNTMASATQRFISFAQGKGDLDRLKKIFNISSVLHWIIGLLVFFILEFGGYFFFEMVLKIPADRLYAAKIIFQFSVFSTLFTIFSVPYDAVLNSHENMFYVAVLGVLEAVLKLGGALILTFCETDKLVVYGLTISLISVFLLIIRRIYCHRKYEECELKVKKYFDKDIFKEMTKFASWSFLTSSTSIFSNYGLGIVINVFFGPIVNAAQGVASQVNGQLSAFSSNMLKAINPILVKSEGAGNRSKMLNISMTGSKFSFFLLAVLAVPIIIEMPFVLKIWLKNIPNYTIVFCRLELITSLFMQLFVLLATTLAAQGNIANASKIKSLIIIAPIPVLFLLFKYTDANPFIMYVIVLAGHCLRELVNMYFAHKNCGLDLKIFVQDVIGRSLLVIILMSGISYIPIALIEQGYIRFIAVVFLSSVTFLIALYLVGLTKTEKAMFSLVGQELKIRINKIRVQKLS